MEVPVEDVGAAMVPAATGAAMEEARRGATGTELVEAEEGKRWENDSGNGNGNGNGNGKDVVEAETTVALDNNLCCKDCG
jgi:hypothetical protein